MKVEIYGRNEIEQRIRKDFPKNASVISFYTPKTHKKAEEIRVSYVGVTDSVFYVGIPDIDREILLDYGYTYETYLSEADALAAFIYHAKEESRTVICQCDYGQSRSAACAAAILEHFHGCGIDIFADYRYYPNQLVYHKVFDALQKYSSAK